jgi:hypothetical protein
MCPVYSVTYVPGLYRILLPSHWEGTEGRAWTNGNVDFFVGGVKKEINFTIQRRRYLQNTTLHQVSSPLPDPLQWEREKL